MTTGSAPRSADRESNAFSMVFTRRFLLPKASAFATPGRRETRQFQSASRHNVHIPQLLIVWHAPCEVLGRTRTNCRTQGTPAMHWIDPDYLPEIIGTVDQFLVNKHSEADGFLLTDGGEVHVPPHLSSRLLRDVRPGSTGQGAWNSPARRRDGCGGCDRYAKGPDSR